MNPLGSADCDMAVQRETGITIYYSMGRTRRSERRAASLWHCTLCALQVIERGEDLREHGNGVDASLKRAPLRE